MRDSLFIGTSRSVEVDAVLEGARLRLTQLGIPAALGDLVALKVKNGNKTRHNRGLLDDSYIELLFKSDVSYVGITHFETEIVPGYSVIKEPFTIGVGVWVGADEIYKVLAACVAAAIAANVDTKIQDSEHIWSDSELNDPSEFMEKVSKKFKQ